VTLRTARLSHPGTALPPWSPRRSVRKRPVISPAHPTATREAQPGTRGGASPIARGACNDATPSIVTVRVTGPQTTNLASMSHPPHERRRALPAPTRLDNTQSLSVLRVAAKETCSPATVDTLSDDLPSAWRTPREQPIAHLHPARHGSQR
jgi:hypothetical protein